MAPQIRYCLGLPVTLVLALSTTLLATEHARFTTRVIGVTDGDTITVLRGESPVKIRLQGIDCPERAQAFGVAAKRFTSELLFGRIVTVNQSDVDRYGRVVANVTVDGQDVGLAIVRAGYAWHFLSYSHDPILAAAEKEARAARRGLWHDEHPVPPWVFRRPHPAKATSPQAASGPVTYHGNVSSRVFHGPTCPYYNCKSCVVMFASSQAAKSAGFRPHTECVR